MYSINDMVPGQSHYGVYPSASRSERAERAALTCLLRAASLSNLRAFFSYMHLSDISRMHHESLQLQLHELHWLDRFSFFKQVCFSQPPQPALQLDCCEVRDWTSLSGNYPRCVGNQCGSLWVNVVQSRFPWLRSHFRAESLEPLIISWQIRNVLIYPALIKWSSFY